MPLLKRVNGIPQSIQFTHEAEDTKNCLPFLDVLLQRGSDGLISTSVYRKSPHTDRYLDFTSHDPLTHKAAMVRTLFSRLTPFPHVL